MKQRIFLGIFLIINILFGMGNVDALTSQEKVTAIIANPTGVPVPPNGEPKGFVGSLLADIFWASGKIKTIFISAFQDIDTGANNNTIPRWIKATSGSEGKFAAGTMTDSGSYIGIGTRNPRQKLDVAGSINFSGNLYKNGVLYTPSLPNDIVRTFGNQTIGGVKTFTGNIVAGSRTIYLGNIQNIYGDNASALVYNSNHGSTSQIFVRDRNNVNYGRIYGSGTGAEFGLLDGDGDWSYRAVKDTSTQFRINNNTVMTLSGVNVGVGTNNPRGRLHVNTTTDASLTSTGHALTLGNVGGSNLILDNNEILARDNGASTTLYIQGSSSTGNTILNSDSGNVGIGIGNPTAKLHVSGNIIASSPTANNHVATKKYVDDLQNTQVQSTVGSELNGLVAGNKYIVFFSGDVTDDFKPLVKTCNGNTILSTQNPQIGLTGRTTVPSHMTQIIAPSNGCIKAEIKSGVPANYVFAFSVN